MKRYINTTAILIGFTVLLRAQTSTKSYIMTETFLNDSATRSIKAVQYYDGLGQPSQLMQNGRYDAGMKQGLYDAASLFTDLKRDEKGNIIENIRLVSHSMGSAYAKGYAQALVNYIYKYPKLTSGISITEYDFAPYEPTMQKAVKGVDTYQYSHKYDLVAGNKKIEGAHYMKTSESFKDGHSISSFWQYILNLPEGKYVFENGIPQIVK